MAVTFFLLFKNMWHGIDRGLGLGAAHFIVIRPSMAVYMTFKGHDIVSLEKLLNNIHILSHFMPYILGIRTKKLHEKDSLLIHTNQKAEEGGHVFLHVGLAS
ncbi:hypothetical protein ACJX0J_020775, partial [Zea mays]